MSCICYKELEENSEYKSQCYTCGQRLMVFGAPHILYTPSHYVIYPNKLKVKKYKPYLLQVYHSLLLDGIEKKKQQGGYGKWLSSLEGKKVKRGLCAMRDKNINSQLWDSKRFAGV
jgi:hypothetical protein